MNLRIFLYGICPWEEMGLTSETGLGLGLCAVESVDEARTWALLGHLYGDLPLVYGWTNFAFFK